MIKTTVAIEGMMCPHCEAHMKRALQAAFAGARSVAASHKAASAVIVSEEPLDPQRLEAAGAGAGYEFKGARSEPFKPAGFMDKLKGLLG